MVAFCPCTVEVNLVLGPGMVSILDPHQGRGKVVAATDGWGEVRATVTIILPGTSLNQ